MSGDRPGGNAAVICEDGYRLAVHAFDADAPRDEIVLLATATGVPARFYLNFCSWLAERHYSSIVWDWRGVGENAPPVLRDSRATMLDWATLDLPAVVDWARERFDDRPLIGLGHSFGGQAFGLAGRPERFARLILFASGHAYWRHWPIPGRYLFRIAVSALPAVTRFRGYLPGRALGLGADLPAGVAAQWFRWCRRPDYFGRWDGHARITAPVHSVGFSDDRYAPLVSREALLQKYGGRKQLTTWSPADFDLPSIGHLDFFRQRHATTLWPALLPMLESPGG